jgi:uncharacterized protein (DUF433 family)
MSMHDELIVSDPKIMTGKSVVRGTRITVESIVERVGAGESIEAIVGAHPRLTHEGVLAAIEAAVRELVDQSEGEFDGVAKRLLEKNRELYERLR